jgi:hypothetical protein
MSDETQSPTNEPIEPLPTMAQRPNDQLLELLVKSVNRVDFTFSITLFVGGTVMCGQLCGGRMFFNGFGEQWADAWKRFEGPLSAEADPAFWIEQGELRYPREGEVPGPALIQHVHMKNVKLTMPNGEMRTVDWWRGQLSAVDGWALGEWGPAIQKQ